MPPPQEQQEVVLEATRSTFESQNKIKSSKSLPYGRGDINIHNHCWWYCWSSASWCWCNQNQKKTSAAYQNLKEQVMRLVGNNGELRIISPKIKNATTIFLKHVVTKKPNANFPITNMKIAALDFEHQPLPMQRRRGKAIDSKILH